MVVDYKQGWELPFDSVAGLGFEEVHRLLLCCNVFFALANALLQVDITIGDRDDVTPLMIAVEVDAMYFA